MFSFWLLSCFFPVVSCFVWLFCFHRKIEMIFVVVYNLENRNPPETENKSARNGNARAKAGRALVQAGHKSKQFEVAFSQKKTKLWIMFEDQLIDGFLDFCWFFWFFAPKSPSFFCFFEIVIRSKCEYKVVHCVDLTIFFLSIGGGLKLFDFFSNCRFDCYKWRRRCLTAADCSSKLIVFLVNVLFFLIFCSL